MTGGRLKRVRIMSDDDETFCLTYGDGVADIDIAAQLAFHQRHGRKATVTAVRPPRRFGAHRDRGRPGSSVSGKADERRRLDQWRLLRAVARGGRLDRRRRDGVGRRADGAPGRNDELHAYGHHGFWQPMDTLRDKNYLEESGPPGRRHWRVW